MTERKCKLRVLSLGAGVQSTTMLLMACADEFATRPDCAIFADTGWEPRAVYDHLAWLQSLGLPIPIHVVSAGNIRDDALGRSGYASDHRRSRFASMPLHVRNADGSSGMIRRQCTSEYKLMPIQKKVLELMGFAHGREARHVYCEQWIGISLDEAHRMRDSQVRYVRTRYPLIEKGMFRGDCIHWLTARGYPIPPKSACIGCPFKDNARWSALKHDSPDEWQEAVDFDRSIRNGNVRLGKAGLRGHAFLHRDLIPLDEVDLSKHPKRDNSSRFDAFGEECTGMCGV